MDIQAKPNLTPMFITIYAGGMPFSFDTITNGKSLGGSESAAYYMGESLAKLGHTVTMFTSENKAGFSEAGVRYEYHGERSERFPLGDRFDFAMKAPQDIVICQRHPAAFATPPNSKLNIWWLHDLAIHRNAKHIERSLVNIDSIFTVSEFHKKQVNSVWGIDEKFIYATKNGVEYANVWDSIKDVERLEKNLCFASRPERGLEELVGENGIMTMLPDYTLHVCGYNNTTKDMVNYYRYLYSRCEELPNVVLHGYLGKSDLYKLMASCQATVYPTMFEDTSNIVALETAACKTPFIAMNNGAVPETCKSGFALLVNPENGAVNRRTFAHNIAKVCETPSLWKKLHRESADHYQSWGNIAIDWDKMFRKALQAKSSNNISLVKHFENTSDIVAMTKVVKEDVINTILPDFKENYGFFLNNTFEDHYRRYYEYEKARGVNYGPEKMDGNVRFECIATIIGRAEPATVLDYGCAHGHYTVNLAKRMPNILFRGADLAQSNVDIANKWAADEKLQNVTFIREQHSTLPEDQKFDLIIAAEVLEHVTSPQAVVDKLIEHLNPFGTMVISVPYGPWEAIGYAENKGWRAHIHHLERQDLKEIFGHFDDYKCLALPHSNNLGHYVLTFTKPNDERKCGYIDYQRKAVIQAPRQTLSVCMIAKNEALNIGKCLESVSKIADEIIIGIDEGTTDNTKQIAESFGAICFGIPGITGDNGIGFATGRNLTIERATSDWILWIDADEVIENIEHLRPYLRQNQYKGYMIQQCHFSVEPPALLQTDYPCRIFRNRHGIQFFGEVHEHPSISTDANAGPGQTYIMPSVGITHTGYSTENKRRGRFGRNFPLLKRDRAVNPDRILGKFLYIRDLNHCVRYDMERSGGAITPFAINAANEAIGLWESILNDQRVSLRYVVDSLVYYSECVKITSPNPINFKISFNDVEIKGLFRDSESIKKLSNRIIEAQTDIYSKRYF